MSALRRRRPPPIPGSEIENRSPNVAGESKIQNLKSKIAGLPDQLLLDDLTEQLDRTRRLLTTSPEEVAESALARMADEAGAEARITAELAERQPLAQPERFPEAHRLTMHALEILEREGSRNPRVRGLGPLNGVAELLVEFVAEYIVQSYAESIVGRLRKLYCRREVQCPPGTPERRILAGARVEIERVAPGFGGGGIGAPILLVAGAAVPVLASISQYLGAIDLTVRWIQVVALAAAFVIVFALSGILLRGAAVAHRRSQLIMRQPLAALWETVGHAGNPPEDDGVLFATISIVLTALVWIVLPLVALLVISVF